MFSALHQSASSVVQSIFYPFTTSSDISEELMEEYRMISNFKQKEIIRLHSVFHDISSNKSTVTRDEFLNISALVHNPLKERVALCFGYDEECIELDFRGFLKGLALFNGPGQREQKLRTAFRIQDFDGDGVINKSDLTCYIQKITCNSLKDEEVENIVSQLMGESSSDVNQDVINFSDFQKVVAPSDFQAKLLLPI
jgi:Ca2+-binding EF-hand superfamily protein